MGDSSSNIDVLHDMKSILDLLGYLFLLGCGILFYKIWIRKKYNDRLIMPFFLTKLEAATALYPTLPKELVKEILGYEELPILQSRLHCSFDYSLLQYLAVFTCPVVSCAKRIQFHYPVAGTLQSLYVPPSVTDHVKMHSNGCLIWVYNTYGDRLGEGDGSSCATLHPIEQTGRKTGST